MSAILQEIISISKGKFIFDLSEDNKEVIRAALAKLRRQEPLSDETGLAVVLEEVKSRTACIADYGCRWKTCYLILALGLSVPCIDALQRSGGLPSSYNELANSITAAILARWPQTKIGIGTYSIHSPYFLLMPDLKLEFPAPKATLRKLEISFCPPSEISTKKLKKTNLKIPLKLLLPTQFLEVTVEPLFGEWTFVNRAGKLDYCPTGACSFQEGLQALISIIETCERNWS